MRLVLLAALSAMFAGSASAACLDDIKSSIDLGMTSGPYRFATKIFVEQTEMMTVDGIVIPGRSMHTTTVAGEMTQEFVVVDRNGWMRMDGAAWEVIPADMLGDIEAALGGIGESLRYELENAKCLGAVEFEGETYLGYGFEYSVTDATSTTILYVDEETKIPLRMRAVATTDGQSTDVGTDYFYDPSIVIEPPPGVQ